MPGPRSCVVGCPDLDILRRQNKHPSPREQTRVRTHPTAGLLSALDGSVSGGDPGRWNGVTASLQRVLIPSLDNPSTPKRSADIVDYSVRDNISLITVQKGSTICSTTCNTPEKHGRKVTKHARNPVETAEERKVSTCKVPAAAM